MELEIADDAMVEEKRDKFRRVNPLEAGFYVHGPGEEIRMHGLNIGADEASEDGKALRLANATAANVGLHYLGEGETVNYATAREMGEPTTRYYAERQANLVQVLLALTHAAYHRFCVMTRSTYPDDLQLTASITEVARADNESLAKSANLVVRALIEMANQGWIDDETAALLAFKFAGEPLGPDDVAAILAKARPKPEPEPDPQEQP
jgi:hypothetical protein